MTKTKNKTKRTATLKLSPIKIYSKAIDTYLEDEGFYKTWERVVRNVRFLKLKYFLRENKKGTRMLRWFEALGNEDKLTVIDNMVGPFLDANTIAGKNPGDNAMRTRTLKLLGCPTLQ